MEFIERFYVGTTTRTAQDRYGDDLTSIEYFATQPVMLAGFAFMLVLFFIMI